MIQGYASTAPITELPETGSWLAVHMAKTKRCPTDGEIRQVNRLAEIRMVRHMMAEDAARSTSSA
jgi:hypothetical protein